MKILVTNDDGVTSPGIKALWELALEFGDEVFVLAPNRGYSGMSHAITMTEPIYLDSVLEETTPEGKHLKVYSTNGSPVDCIKLALDELYDNERPDLILSGVNHGSNSNISIIYSGTMGAASEGAFYGIPSLGFSLCSHDHSEDLSAVTHFGRQIIAKALTYPQMHPTLCWNVNIPVAPIEEIKGIKFTRQTVGFWQETFTENINPLGRKYYWMHGAFTNQEPEVRDNDEWLLSENYITIVPVQMDMTNYKFLEAYGSEF